MNLYENKIGTLDNVRDCNGMIKAFAIARNRLLNTCTLIGRAVETLGSSYDKKEYLCYSPLASRGRLLDSPFLPVRHTLTTAAGTPTHKLTRDDRGLK